VSLWKATLEQPATSGQRKRLMADAAESMEGTGRNLEKEFLRVMWREF